MQRKLHATLCISVLAGLCSVGIAAAQTVTTEIAPGVTTTAAGGEALTSIPSDAAPRGGQWQFGTCVFTAEPFEGDASEAFNESVVFLPCIPGRIFDNTADLCTPGASGTHTTSGWGFACTIFARSQPLLYGSAGGYTEIVFDKPVGSFGGYFGTNAPGSTGGNAIFFDEANNELANLRINTGGVESCTWNWNGWRVNTSNCNPIKRVELWNEVFGGAFLDMDDLEYSFAGGGGFDPCDTNCDTAIDAFDIEPFIDLLVNPSPSPCSPVAGDANGDGVVDAFDIEPFIACLVGP